MNANLCPLCRQSMRLWALDSRRVPNLKPELYRLAIRTAQGFRDECLHTDREKYLALVNQFKSLTFKSSPLANAVWSEIERIKNCHGGNIPSGQTYHAWPRLAAAALLLLSTFILQPSTFAQTLPEKFFTAIHTVETSRRLGPILGDGGRALGPYQIHHAYWQDANVPGTYAQVADERYARRVVTAYLTRYGRAAVAHGDLETLARIHNGGPLGHRRASTLPYWNRVRRHL